MEPATGEIDAEHAWPPPGDQHGRSQLRPLTPEQATARGARAKTAAKNEFLALETVAEAFLTGDAAAG